MIKNLSNILHKDIYFLYNNLHRDSIIDEDFSYYICRMIQENKDFEDALVLLHSKGGNLKSGGKIADFFHRMYNNVSYYVPERCGSTATLMLLSGDVIYLDDASIVTPCEPQMDTVSGMKVSVNDIRNYIQDYGEDGLDVIDLCKYHSTVRYFRDLCHKLYGENTFDKIIHFMLNDINSHDYFISVEELALMGIAIGHLEDLPVEELHFIHEFIKDIQRMEKRHIGSVILGSHTGYIFRKDIGDDNRKIKEEYEKVESNKVLIKR